MCKRTHFTEQCLVSIKTIEGSFYQNVTQNVLQEFPLQFVSCSLFSGKDAENQSFYCHTFLLPCRLYLLFFF